MGTITRQPGYYPVHTGTRQTRSAKRMQASSGYAVQTNPFENFKVAGRNGILLDGNAKQKPSLLGRFGNALLGAAATVTRVVLLPVELAALVVGYPLNKIPFVHNQLEAAGQNLAENENGVLTRTFKRLMPELWKRFPGTQS